MDLTITEENATIFEKSRALLNELSMSFVMQKKSFELAACNPIGINDSLNSLNHSTGGSLAKAMFDTALSSKDTDYAPGNFFDQHVLAFQDELQTDVLKKMDRFGAKLSDLHEEMLEHDWSMDAPDGFVEKFKELGEEMQLLEEGVKHATEAMASVQSGSMHIRKEGNQAFQKFNEVNKPVVQKSLPAASKTHAIPAAFRRGVN